MAHIEFTIHFMRKLHNVQSNKVFFSLFLNESIRLLSVLWPEVPKPMLSEEFLKKVSPQCSSTAHSTKGLSQWQQCKELIYIHTILLIPNTISQDIFGVYGKFVTASVALCKLTLTQMAPLSFLVSQTDVISDAVCYL